MPKPLTCQLLAAVGQLRWKVIIETAARRVYVDAQRERELFGLSVTHQAARRPDLNFWFGHGFRLNRNDKNQNMPVIRNSKTSRAAIRDIPCNQTALALEKLRMKQPREDTGLTLEDKHLILARCAIKTTFNYLAAILACCHIVTKRFFYRLGKILLRSKNIILNVPMDYWDPPKTINQNQPKICQFKVLEVELWQAQHSLCV
jgi:hypothetical protein